MCTSSYILPLFPFITIKLIRFKVNYPLLCISRSILVIIFLYFAFSTFLFLFISSLRNEIFFQIFFIYHQKVDDFFTPNNIQYIFSNMWHFFINAILCWNTHCDVWFVYFYNLFFFLFGFTFFGFILSFFYIFWSFLHFAIIYSLCSYWFCNTSFHSI